MWLPAYFKSDWFVGKCLGTKLYVHSNFPFNIITSCFTIRCVEACFDWNAERIKICKGFLSLAPPRKARKWAPCNIANGDLTRLSESQWAVIEEMCSEVLLKCSQQPLWNGTYMYMCVYLWHCLVTKVGKDGKLAPQIQISPGDCPKLIIRMDARFEGPMDHHSINDT